MADSTLQSVCGLLIALTIACVQFDARALCDLHGFSPQNTKSLGWKTDGSKRDTGSSFYKALQQAANQRFHEQYSEYSASGEILTHEIRIKQGRLKGLVKEFKSRKLKNVETFLGIPYAAAPVKALRFMPPGSPPTWTNVKIFDTFGPVCPQRPPDLTREPLKTMNAGQYNRFKGLMPFLTNQSEDCLYLNIYAPEQDYSHPKKFPVIVYIHGESFEWNSGNPYDGSILSSYGNVVVVTINFRLGILGFLKPGLSEHTVSNFGLLDQIAALQWIKENIGEFGGDSSSVTLMGHGTGAACINFLMVSPVSMASEGLFHKAILMSGTALSDWAVTHNPLQFTIQVAEALNCPLVEKNDELTNCLRKKRLSEIMSVKVNVPEFLTPFGPIVDGSVVPNTPQQVMGVYQNLFTRYDLLYGVTQWEAYNLLDPVSLTYGMLEEERNDLLKKYMYSRFEALPYFALATTLSEYMDWGKTVPAGRSAAEEHRDLALDLLSDARYTAPILQMATYHSKINPRSYMYVFMHKSIMGENAEKERSVSGEEISYVFGRPLLNEESPLSHHRFTSHEQLLSEFILTYFTNFARTGNPNAPRRVEYLNLGPKEWQDFDVYWPEYEPKNQSYLALDVPPRIDHRYRVEMAQFWNKVLPNLLSNPTKVNRHKPEMPSTSYGDFAKAPPFVRKAPPSSNDFSYYSTRRKPSSEDRDSWTYGTVRLSPSEGHKTPPRPFKIENESENSLSKQMDHPFENDDVDLDSLNTHSTWIPHLVAVILCLLLINGAVIAVYLYKKKKTTRAKNNWREYTPGSLGDGGFEERLKRVESFYASRDCSENEAFSNEPPPPAAKEKNETAEGLKKFFTNASASPSKMKNWIRSEILAKKNPTNRDPIVRKSEKKGAYTGSPESVQMKPLKKKIQNSGESSLSEAPPKEIYPILKNSKRIYKSHEELNGIPKSLVQKVSVGIDATPSSRGESVLKQTPIELTKSLDGGILINRDVCTENLDEPGDLGETFKSPRPSRTSISLQILPTNDDKSIKFVTSSKPEIIKLVPKSSEGAKNHFLTFFERTENPEDVNVTSRDSRVSVSAAAEKAPVDPLENIQKRNFPKVLPDFPNFKAVKRLSLPQSTLLNIAEPNRNKLGKVKSPKSTQQLAEPPPPPPPPPPRVSTLRRKDKQITGNQDEEPKFLTFSSVNLKMPDLKGKQGEDGAERDKEKIEENSEASTSTASDKSISTAENSVKENANAKQKSRDPPRIVIKPKVGPRKPFRYFEDETSAKKGHVNLQAKDSEGGKPTIDRGQAEAKSPADKSKAAAKTK